jgi:hypothetical protein
MAVKISKELTTQEGFVVSECFGFLSIYLLNDSWTNVSYFKSEADYLAGKSPLNIQELPSRVSLEITAEQFWGTTLATDMHEKVKAAVEAVTGEGTVTIVTLESSNA